MSNGSGVVTTITLPDQERDLLPATSDSCLRDALGPEAGLVHEPYQCKCHDELSQIWAQLPWEMRAAIGAALGSVQPDQRHYVLHVWRKGVDRYGEAPPDAPWMISLTVGQNRAQKSGATALMLRAGFEQKHDQMWICDLSAVLGSGCPYPPSDPRNPHYNPDHHQ